MDKIDIKVVVGAGYGDEGKGLMTDYFCSHSIGKTLNIKVNGGAQAGHTVCKLDNKGYKHHVFRQYGSGTFNYTDTYLLDTFMVNIDELLKEKNFLESIYGIHTNLYIDRRCRITLPMDILMNRFIEDKRTHKHGSCGLGIFETFHRNNEIEYITVKDIILESISGTPGNFRTKLLNRAKDFYRLRLEAIYESEGIEITEGEYEDLISKTDRMNTEFMKNLFLLGGETSIILVDSLESILDKNKYNTLVFECSQGLELDQFNKRNWPHLTPSNTGLLNVSKELKNNKHLNKADIEICFVSRSYKTKHGAGEFIEFNPDVQDQFNLYDRTNQINRYQGSLRYGLLNLGRMKRLIVDQLDHIDGIETNISFAVTHLDQTNGLLLCNNEQIEYKDITERFKGIATKYYFSFGEKESDIII